MYPGIRQTTASNTPSVLSSATALASNTARIGWMIQNQGTNPLYLLLGSGATSSIYHIILKGSTGAADGSGAVYSQSVGTIYTGIITVAGTSPSYTVLEMAP